jgi:hypothetical protein
MKLYTVFTESHYDMFKDYFIKSFPFDVDLELVVKFKPQVCPTSEFHSQGWRDTMQYKVQCFIDAAYETKDGECFMFSDPDIQFFKTFSSDVLKHIEGCDAAFQNDYGGGVNTGFFIMRSTSKTRAFLKTVQGNLHNFPEEQVCFNALMRHFNDSRYDKIAYRWRFLPKEYWTYGELAWQRVTPDNSSGTWQGHEEFNIPENIIIHHANWTSSFKNKIKLLDSVKQKYDKLKTI